MCIRDSYNALSSFFLIKVVEQLSHVVNLVEVVEQRHTEVDFYVLQILVIKMSILYITVVCEFLHSSNNVGKLLTRDNLKTLYVNGFVLSCTDSVEEVTWLVVVARLAMLTCACTVDTDVRREAEVNVCIWESSLISSFCLVESSESICPCRTESHEEHCLVFARLSLLCSHLLVVESVLRDDALL